MARDLPTHSDLELARTRIRDFVNRTPVLTSTTLNERADARVYLKAENFQKTGSFKYRGATNAVQSLPPSEAERGVATHSSGNHAQALALAARTRGIRAHIVMPENSVASKREAVLAYGGQVTLCEPTLEAREQGLAAVIAKTGATPIHPYDDARIIAGQGTAAIELLEDEPDLDLLLAPVGGGGLLSGCAIAAHGKNPDIRVLGAEPELADDAYRSLAAGQRLPANPPRTVADGLRTALGELNYEVLRQEVEAMVLVSEVEILDAMRFVWERLKVVIEPSGAVPVAALLGGKLDLHGLKVGVILSGGNVDLCRNELCHFWKPTD